ncbi:MAG: hypothetical protein GC154_00935 [bacterium]|nr:hypothetical protein [bacterium]
MKQGVLLGLIASTAVVFSTAVAADDSISFWDGKASIGGEIRGRGEVSSDFYKPNGTSDYDDDFFLLRSKLHLDVRPDDTWRVFLEAQDSRAWGSDRFNHTSVPNAFQDDLDLFQGYVDVHHIFDSPLSLRVGRQILAYGKQRLLGGFLWSNVSRSFDAVKVSLDLPDFYGGSIDAFVGEPVTHDWGNFNEFLEPDNRLYGVYSTWKDVPYVDFLEAYYLLREDDSVDDEVHTLGVRTGRAYDSRWDWEIELAGQFGDYRGLDHEAFASHIELGYTAECPWNPRMSLGYSYATGDDDPLDGEHNTFDNLFPTNHIHYGQMDLFSWRNGHDIELKVNAKPLEKLTAQTEVHFFILDEPNGDAWYSAGGAPVRTAIAGVNADSYLGTELDLKLQYQVCDNFQLESGYSHFFAGSYVDDTGDDSDADWGYLQATITF